LVFHGLGIVLRTGVPNGEDEHFLAVAFFLDSVISLTPAADHEVRPVGRLQRRDLVVKRDPFARRITEMHRTTCNALEALVSETWDRNYRGDYNQKQHLDNSLRSRDSDNKFHCAKTPITDRQRCHLTNMEAFVSDHASHEQSPKPRPRGFARGK